MLTLCKSISNSIGFCVVVSQHGKWERGELVQLAGLVWITLIAFIYSQGI